ncbi:MAG: ASCH domain-containing protein [Deltaproteobacteria bacterium]|nr:ASCH domain-containing protein [Deltaproteobacteria bacterium]
MPKALTIVQPWASLIADGFKSWEMRSWPTSYRGQLLIHAGRGKLTKQARTANAEALRTWMARTVNPEFTKAACYFDRTDLPIGRIVAVADLVGCHRITGSWRTSPAERKRVLLYGLTEPAVGEVLFGWVLANVRRVDGPACKGMLGLWTLDEVVSI